MNEINNKCARCGAAVSPDALQGICPACLLALNLSAPTEESGPGGTKVTEPVPPGPSIEELANLFPQLEIIEPLGRGGMGAVYKARQPKLDRLVALKILLRRQRDSANDAAFAERFCREARALARLAHPDIVAVYDYGEVGGYPYFIMEYVDGVTLRKLLQRGKLTPEEALAIVPKICEALQFAHQQGVVHRDIKPENILIDKAGRVKIADFGIAKIVDPGAGQLVLTGGKDVIGTPHYMAPEQVERPQQVDHRADIFSLGVVFYEMLTGELPLGKFRPPSQKVRVDVRLDEIVLRALEKEPERRYQHISQVKTDVESVTSSASSSDNLRAGKDTSSSKKRELDQKRAAIAVGGLGVACLSMLAMATQVRPGAPVLLSLCAAAGFLVAAIHFGRIRWWRGRVETSPASAAPPCPPKVVPPFLVLLCALMLMQGFYALLETVLRMQPGVAIFPNVVCLVTGIGLLFLRPWARILSLAWVWVSYLLYLAMALLLIRARFPGANADLKMEVMGRAIDDPRLFAVAVLVFVSAAAMVPWTHWLLTREHIKRLFVINQATASGRSNKWGLAFGIAIILTALFVWMAAPKRYVMVVSGTVKSETSGEPVQAEVVVAGSKSRKWTTTANKQGSYRIEVPPDAGMLYTDKSGVRHRVQVTISAQASGFEPSDVALSQTRQDGYSKRSHDFQLKPLGRTDSHLLQCRRVLENTETNVDSVWLETQNPAEPRLPVDSRVVIGPNDIESAMIVEEVFVTPGAPTNNQLSVRVKMTESGALAFARFTKTNIDRRVAIIVGGKVVSAPVIRTEITGGLGQITGNFSFAEGLDLAQRLNRLDGGFEAEHVFSKNGSELFDLDRGKTSKWSADAVEWNELGMERWLEKSRADVFAGPGGADFSVLGVRGVRLAHAEQGMWEAPPRRGQLLDALSRTNALEKPASPAPYTLLRIGSDLPQTYMFCTSEGSAGVLQISRGSNQLTLACKVTAAEAASKLGPTMERTVNDDGVGHDFFIDLESGKTFTSPKGINPEGVEFLQWMRKQGIDAMADTSISIRGLVGIEIAARPIPAERWNSIEADDILRDEVLRNSRTGSPVFLSAKGKLPETYLVRTRDGTSGILQIVGFTENPRSVEIRYRMIQKSSF